MNAARLASMYDKLTPAERLRLLHAAVERGDEVEKSRLMRTASVISRRLLDYQPLQSAQRTLKLTTVLVWLDIAVDFWTTCGGAQILDLRRQLRGRHEVNDSAPVDVEDPVQRNRADGMLRYHAYRLVVNLDAWTQFCSERIIDPLVELKILPGWANVAQAEPIARPLAFTYEQACEFARAIAAMDGGEPWDVEDHGDIVKNLHALLDTLLELEGGK